MPISKYSKKLFLNEAQIPDSKEKASFYKSEKGYKYYVKDGKWRGIIVKNNKEFDVMKYPSTVEKLNKEFGTSIGEKESDESQESLEQSTSSSGNVKWLGTGGYEASNVKLVMDQIDKYSKEKYPALNNGFLRVAILSKIAVECRFKMSREKNYKSVARAKQMLGKSSLAGLTDEQVAALIKSPKEFWEYVYGQGLGGNINGVEVPKSPYYKKHGKAPGIKKGLGNDKVGDGYKYRGRGFIQFTGKYQYKKYGNLAGVDGVGNPDSFLEPETSAKLSIVRIMKGIEMFGGGIKDYKDQESANIAVTKSVAGKNASSEKIARTTSHNKNFEIVSKEEPRALAERKIISEKNLRYLMRALIKENIDERKPQSKEEGNKFRKWVNDNIPKSEIEALFTFSSDKNLDLEGSINNSHFNVAWKEFGEEYLEDTASDNPDDVPGESQTSDQSKGYPDSKENAAVMNKDEKYRYYVKDVGGKNYWTVIITATGKEVVFKGDTAKNKKAVDTLNKYFGTNFTASEPGDAREFDFYPSEAPNKMQPAGRGIPEPYFKFRKGDRSDASMEIFGMTAGGDIYYTSNTDPAIEKDERGRLKFVKLNENRSIKKVLINESGTKARIVLENISAVKKFDLTKEFMKDLQALNLSDEEVPGIVQAEGEAETKVDAMVQPKADKGKGEKGSADPSIHTFIDEASLPIRFEQQDMSEGAREAEKIMAALNGVKHTTEAGAKKIVDIVIKPAIERFGKTSEAAYYKRKPVPLSDVWKYIGTSETGGQRTPWSGHTLNAFITPSHPFFATNKSLGTLGISYFWPWMLRKRKEVENDPESYIGQTIMMPFSKEEIDKRSDITLEDGVFSLNGRGGVPIGAGLKTFMQVALKAKGAVSGAHMNVYSGGKLIGGNLSKTVKTQTPTDGFHTIYFILVKVLSNDVPVT